MRYIEKSRIANSAKIKKSKMLNDGIFVSSIIMLLLGLMMVESHTVVGGIMIILATMLMAFAGRNFEEMREYED